MNPKENCQKLVWIQNIENIPSKKAGRKWRYNSLPHLLLAEWPVWVIGREVACLKHEKLSKLLSNLKMANFINIFYFYFLFLFFVLGVTFRHTA